MPVWVGSISVTIGVFHAVMFFFSSRRRHTRFDCDWSSDVCFSDLGPLASGEVGRGRMVDPDEIAVAVEGSMGSGPLAGRTVQIGRASCRERVCARGTWGLP